MLKKKELCLHVNRVTWLMRLRAIFLLYAFLVFSDTNAANIYYLYN